MIQPTLRPAVFLDRDGTLNAATVRDGKPYPPLSPAEFVLLPGVSTGCSRLKAAGFILVVATNQPDVGRGTQTQVTVEAIHQRMRQLVPEIDHVEVSYDAGGSATSNRRRKPAPGMLLDAAGSLNLDLPRSWMIGDRWRDVDCGHAAGCQTIFIDLNYHEKLSVQPNYFASNFTEAVAILLAHSPDRGQNT